MLGPERAAAVCGGRIRMRQGIAAQARFHSRAEQPRGFARGTEVRPSELREGPPARAVADHAQHLRGEEEPDLGRAVDGRTHQCRVHVSKSATRRLGNAAVRPMAHYLPEGPKEDAMGILDRVFGQQQPSPPGDAQRAPQELSDEQALQRYRYLVRTAPPEAIEEAHREAFARLTPEQRAQLLRELNAAAPANERISDPSRDDPQTLARMATRAELRQPG